MARTSIRIAGSFALIVMMALLLIGCRGKDGRDGTNGASGQPGQPGAPFALDVGTFAADEWERTTFKSTITRVSAGATTTVDFTITDGRDVPLKGFAAFTSKRSQDAFPTYPNLAFGLAKLVPGVDNAPSRWVSYLVTSNPTAQASSTWVPRRPTTDNIGTLVDHGDGTYTYTFRRDITQVKAQLDAYAYTGDNVQADLDDITYQPTLTHRMTLFVGGPARGTGTAPENTFNTADGSDSGRPGVYPLSPANAQYDFIPATGQPIGASAERRDIVSSAACLSCHAKFTFHASGRQDTRYCVVCHTDQRKYGRPEATPVTGGYDPTLGTFKIQNRAQGDFVTMVHRLHMGEELKKTGYAYEDVHFNEITYPQDHRNCVKCHAASTAAPQGDNWLDKPGRVACGACHDDVDWTQPHHGAVRSDDSACRGCHGATQIRNYHIPAVPPNATFATGGYVNGSTVMAFAGNLPPGVHRITYDLQSVTLDVATAKPVFTFRFLKNGTPVVFNTVASGVTEMMDGFVGSPSLILAIALPQDGIATPADWNAYVTANLKKIWNGTATGTGVGTFTGPDSNGYYKVTLTGVTLPATVSMIRGGIGYTYNRNNQPITQIDVPGPERDPNRYAYTASNMMGGVSVPAPNVWKTLSGTLPDGYASAAKAARRTIVDNQKCNACHGTMGVFTSKLFHAGERNDPQTCEMCHNTDRVNASGWAVNTKDFVHAIHGAKKRENKFSWQYASGTKYWMVTYPSLLNNCEACHVPGSYNFGTTANASAMPNLLWSTTATGTTPATLNVVRTGNEAPGTYYAPWVAPSTTYGAAFSFSWATGVITPPASTTLVSSPYVAACANCHDSLQALAHMVANGGSFYVPRSSVIDPGTGMFTKKEQCSLCHASGKLADTQKVHMTYR